MNLFNKKWKDLFTFNKKSSNKQEQIKPEIIKPLEQIKPKIIIPQEIKPQEIASSLQVSNNEQIYEETYKIKLNISNFKNSDIIDLINFIIQNAYMISININSIGDIKVPINSIEYIKVPINYIDNYIGKLIILLNNIFKNAYENRPYEKFILTNEFNDYKDKIINLLKNYNDLFIKIYAFLDSINKLNKENEILFIKLHILLKYIISIYNQEKYEINYDDDVKNMKDTTFFSELNKLKYNFDLSTDEKGQEYLEMYKNININAFIHIIKSIIKDKIDKIDKNILDEKILDEKLEYYNNSNSNLTKLELIKEITENVFIYDTNTLIDIIFNKYNEIISNDFSEIIIQPFYEKNKQKKINSLFIKLNSLNSINSDIIKLISFIKLFIDHAYCFIIGDINNGALNLNFIINFNKFLNIINEYANNNKYNHSLKFNKENIIDKEKIIKILSLYDNIIVSLIKMLEIKYPTIEDKDKQDISKFILALFIQLNTLLKILKIFLENEEITVSYEDNIYTDFTISNIDDMKIKLYKETTINDFQNADKEKLVASNIKDNNSINSLINELKPIKDIKILIKTYYLLYFSTYSDKINKLLKIKDNIKELITKFFSILQIILNIIKTTDKEKINKLKTKKILEDYIDLIRDINVSLYFNNTNDSYNIIIKGIEFTIFLQEILNYLFDKEINIYYNINNNKKYDKISFKKYLQTLDNKLYEYIVKIENGEKEDIEKEDIETKADIETNIKNSILSLNNKFLFKSSFDRNEIDSTKYDINYNILKKPIEGGKNKYKKTENKITVIYKKKQYTRVIYICERKKYIKINKTFMLLSKMKKL
jgi:hypothetical protein